MTEVTKSKGALARFLDLIEKAGNKLPDPAVLFFALLLIVWALSAMMAPISFAEIDPRSGEAVKI
jgi:aminobenzoyl-glutamate transport protein